MAVRPIVKYPDPRLRQQTRTVAKVTDEIRQLVADLTDTMYAQNGAGIAAIQIGAPEKLYLVDAAVAGRAETDPPVVFMNPEIVWLSDETETKDEGCLSFPGIYVPIKRALRCKVRAMDLDGKIFEVEGAELFARAMQHEGDHLNGKLMVDFVGPLKRQMITRKMKKMAEEGEGATDGDDVADEAEAPPPPKAKARR
jgi:peptide deformylase